MVDERMKEVLNKIRNEMLIIIYYIILISFIAKTFLMGLDFKNTITEFVILIFVPIYQAVRSAQLKLSIADFCPEKRKYIAKTVIILCIVAILYTAVMVSNNYTSLTSIVSLIFFIAAFIAARVLSFRHYKKQKERNEKYFDD